MEANLFPIGESRHPHTRIYVLVDRGASEVASFILEGNDDPAITGMVAVLKRIQDFGTRSVSSSVFKQFRSRKKGPNLYQIRKGDWRIACDRYPDNGGSLLLYTCFRKTARIEDREYKRALRAKQSFDSHQAWR